MKNLRFKVDSSFNISLSCGICPRKFIKMHKFLILPPLTSLWAVDLAILLPLASYRGEPPMKPGYYSYLTLTAERWEAAVKGGWRSLLSSEPVQRLVHAHTHTHTTTHTSCYITTGSCGVCVCVYALNQGTVFFSSVAIIYLTKACSSISSEPLRSTHSFCSAFSQSGVWRFEYIKGNVGAHFPHRLDLDVSHSRPAAVRLGSQLGVLVMRIRTGHVNAAVQVVEELI